MIDGAQSDREAVLGWAVPYIATLVGRPAEDISPSDELSVFDLDSVDAVEMALNFEEHFGFAINPETFLDGRTTLDAISRALSAPGSAGG